MSKLNLQPKNSAFLKTQIKALKMLEKDFEKLLQKARKKREKELAKQQITQGLSKEELADLYGYGNILWEEYQAALKRLDNQTEIVTPISEYIRIIAKEIREIQTEIFELEEEIGIKHNIETREERRKRLGLERTDYRNF